MSTEPQPYEPIEHPLLGTFIRRTHDGACIPMDETNPAYQEYLEWQIAQEETP